jgi:RNA polymerase sigma-70 factor (ECF subfamily)
MATETTLRLTLSAFAARRLPDEGAFDRMLAGDPVAFSEVYRRYHKRVYGYCLARSLDPDTAADATQEVFMRLLRAEAGSIENPRSWLFSVARNVSVDIIRKRSRVDPVESLAEETSALGAASAEDPADIVLSKAEGRSVFLALQSLNPRYRSALILRELHGQSSKDIGEALGATVGAVDTMVSRARDAFGAAYASVLDLSPTCRANVELIYRRLGSGITEFEDQALTAHCAGCEACRREAKKAAKPGRLAALLPFLLPAKAFRLNVLSRAAEIGQNVPDAALQQAASIASQPHAINLVARLATGLVAAALIAVPVVGVVSQRADASSTSPGGARATSAAVTSSAFRSLVAPRQTIGSNGGPVSVTDASCPEPIHHPAATISAGATHDSGTASHEVAETHHTAATATSVDTHDSHSTAPSASTPTPATHASEPAAPHDSGSEPSHDGSETAHQ